MAVRTGVLSDRYADARLIGQGGMGEIYLARDRDLGRRVAIKLLAERFARDESLRARFTREALTAARLSTHPNVVTIFDVGEHNGRPFIVMEYLSGGTLAERAREGNVSREQAVRWLDQAAAALDSAHAEGIIHRDVKPANLLLNERDEVHVADFGVARVLDETTSGLTAAGTVMGTAGYLSPEQAQGQPATAESDLYSLAVVAYELLTGGRPFERGSATAEAAAHIHDPVPPASARGVGLPRAVDHVFEQALAKDPSERFRNARALVAALRAALREDETARTRVLPAAVPPPPPSRGAAPPPPPRRRGGALPFVLVGALLLAMLLGGAVAAALLTGDDGGSAGTEPERVTVTRQQTQTQQGTTVVETETVVTTTPGTATEDQGGGGGAGGEGGAVSVDEAVALTDQATGQLGEGNWEEALELANEALPALQGTYANDFRYEAYAEYNTGKALAELDRCDEALPHLERSEQLQGERGEITEAKQQCGG
jgi:tRNA A-37 threonylcarbamoyl transferase component Bud32